MLSQVRDFNNLSELTIPPALRVREGWRAESVLLFSFRLVIAFQTHGV